MSDANQIRINELARELEVKARLILEYLPEIDVHDKKTHSSSVDKEVADKVRKRFLGLAEAEAVAEAAAAAEKAAKEAALKAAKARPEVKPAPAPAAGPAASPLKPAAPQPGAHVARPPTPLPGPAKPGPSPATAKPAAPVARHAT